MQTAHCKSEADGEPPRPGGREARSRPRCTASRLDPFGPCCSFLLFLALPAVFAYGQERAAPQILAVQVGFAGQYKVGLWTPVRLLLRGGAEPTEGTLSLTVPDGEGVPSRVSTPDEAPCKLPALRETSVLLYIRFGRAASELAAEFRSSGGGVERKVFVASPGDASFPPALASGREAIVAVGADLLGLDDAVTMGRLRSDQRPAIASVTDFNLMPDRWFGYEGVDALLLSAGQPERFAGLRRDSPQIVALEEWVQMGGKLLIAGGPRADETLRGGGPLAELAPGKFQRTLPLRQSNALEGFTGGKAAIPRLGGGGRLNLRVVQLDAVDGMVEAREGNLPLVIRRPLGFGHVIFSAAALDEPPIRGWADRGLFVRRLLGMTDSQPAESQDNSAVMHFGYDDLAGQLRSALDQFPSVPLVPFSLVVTILVVYLALIGPLDYFFLRKIAGRMTLTWVTFPLVVVGTSCGAYYLVHRLKGHEVHVNQVNLVDIDAQSGRMRGTAWANLFSPRAERYDLSFEPRSPGGAEVADRQTFWLGLPGEGLGGMHPKTAAPTVWKQPYDFTPGLDGLRGIPIPVWSTRSLSARWTARTEVPVRSQLRDLGQSPGGSLTSALDFPLSDCLLCYGRWVYSLGTLKPGQTITLDPFAERRDLRTFLTGRKLKIGQGKESRELTTPYERFSTDPTYILRAMMFFEAAGGREYTGLWNRYQGFVDLSNLLKSGRAILVATAPNDPSADVYPNARLLRDGRPVSSPGDRPVTVYRFVFPVERGESAVDAP